MRIAFFHELTEFSGARKAVNEYSRILIKNNSVDLYYVDEGNDSECAKCFNAVFFFKFQGRQWHGNGWKAKLYKDTIELIKLYLLHKKIGKLINSKDYDLVVVNPSRYTQTPFILRFISKRKRIYYCPEPLRMVYEDIFSLPQGMPVYKKIYEMCCRKVKKVIDNNNLGKAKLILVNSIFTKNNVSKTYGKDSIVCYPGVDKKKYFPMDFKKTTDVLFLGSKDSIEGYDLLNEALKLFNTKPTLKTISARDNSKGLSEESLIKEYNKSKIVVCLSKNEPFGLIPLEAMSCGMPVIAVNEGGYRETVINGKTGFLINRDKEELADKIRLLLEKPKLAKEFGENGRREILKKWTWERKGKELEKILLNFYGNINNHS
jgi:glycosyltransferase involved in cell wall biosynthesis